MTRALDAAIRAGCGTAYQYSHCIYPNCGCNHAAAIKAAIRAALPVEPEPEVIGAMDEAICERLNDDRSWMLDETKPTPGVAAYRALRARILGEE